MIGRVSFGVAFVFTLFAAGNIVFWLVLHDLYSGELPREDINVLFYSFLPNALEGRSLSKLNMYLSIISLVLFTLSMFTQKKLNVLRTASAIIFIGIDILVVLLMVWWVYF